MSPRPTEELIENIFKRYKKATRQKKSIILDEFCANHKCHRKSAIRIFSKFKKPKLTKKSFVIRGRPPVYDNTVLIKVLRCIWINAYFPCAKNLKACISLWLPSYEKTFGILSNKTRTLLLSISASTIDRIFVRIRVRYKKKGRCTTKPGTLLKNKIPIKTEQWNEEKPGFIEADTIAHCGNSISGQYAFTVDAVDIATQWTEQRAIWGKGEAATFEQIKDIENSMPFKILGFDADNGGEFINYHLYRYFVNRKIPIQFTRSREYNKNDNAHVEQKNWSIVRQWIGYARFDKPILVTLLNDLYKNEWRLYHNFFHPSVKIISKERVGSKTIKHYDKPKTPYQRIMESDQIPDHTKKQLTKIFQLLNPFELHNAIMAKIKTIRRSI